MILNDEELAKLRLSPRREAHDLLDTVADLKHQLKKRDGIIDIIIREIEQDAPEELANDYGGLGWENTPQVIRARAALQITNKRMPAVGFYPESGLCVWKQTALDAHVQEKVDREVLAESEWDI